MSMYLQLILNFNCISYEMYRSVSYLKRNVKITLSSLVDDAHTGAGFASRKNKSFPEAYDNVILVIK